MPACTWWEWLTVSINTIFKPNLESGSFSRAVRCHHVHRSFLRNFLSIFNAQLQKNHINLSQSCHTHFFGIQSGTYRFSPERLNFIVSNNFSKLFYSVCRIRTFWILSIFIFPCSNHHIQQLLQRKNRGKSRRLLIIKIKCR